MSFFKLSNHGENEKAVVEKKKVEYGIKTKLPVVTIVDPLGYSFPMGPETDYEDFDKFEKQVTHHVDQFLKGLLAF